MTYESMHERIHYVSGDCLGVSWPQGDAMTKSIASCSQTSVSMQFSWAAVLLPVDHLSNLINTIAFIQLITATSFGMRADKQMMCWKRVGGVYPA